MKTTLKVLTVSLTLAALLIGGRDAVAQPYFTNSSPQAGAYQYNQNYAQPVQPSVTLSKQYQAGISAGNIAPGTGGAFTTIVSNNFPSGIYYSTTPSITANSSLTGTNGVVWVNSATTTNFTLGVTTTNNNTVYWQAIGH